MNKQATYTKRERNFYLLGLSGQNILYGIISAALAYFLQFTLLIPAVWVGLILSVSRMFDAVKDPLVGAWIGRGKRSLKSYLLLTPMPTAVLTVLCFANGIYISSNPAWKNAVIIAAAFTMYLLWELVFAFGDIPLTGYPSVLTASEVDRTRLLSLRPVGAMVCSITALLVQPLAFALSTAWGGTAVAERNAFLLVAAVFSVAGGGLFQLTAAGSRVRVPVTGQSTRRQMKTALRNPLLRKVLLSGVLGSFRAMPGVVLTPLVSYYFAGKDSTKTLLFTFLLGAGNFVGMLFSMAFVPRLTARFGNRRVYRVANLLNTLPNLLLFLLYLFHRQTMTRALPLTLMFLLTLVVGGCTSVSSTVQTLLISDAAELEAARSGNRPTALFFSFQTFIVKVSAGLSSLAASFAYAVIHFSSHETAQLNALIAAGGDPKTTGAYQPLMLTLFFLYTIPTAVSALLAALPLRKADAA